ncbi:hypothetical protein JYU34_003332, partial [Plutella xylostella]
IYLSDVLIKVLLWCLVVVDIMITWIIIISAAASVCGIEWDAPAQYDPVWLASVLAYPPVPPINETRLWGWVNETDVVFRLFTRRNRFDYEVLHTNDSESLRNSNFNFNRKVKVLTHGWRNHGLSPMPESI